MCSASDHEELTAKPARFTFMLTGTGCRVESSISMERRTAIADAPQSPGTSRSRMERERHTMRLTIGNKRVLGHLWLGLVVTLIGLAGLLSTACGEPDRASDGGPRTVVGGQQPEPTPTYDPHELNVTQTITPPAKEEGEPPPEPTEPTPDQSAPYGQVINVTFGPPVPAAKLVPDYGLWVTGHVVEILPAQWTTPDGQRPENPWATDPGEVFIITPVVIELDGPSLVNRYGADLSAGRVVIAAYGGQVGQDRFETGDPGQRFALGEQVVLGLTDRLYLNGDVERRFQTPAGLAWNVGTKYILTENGMAIPPNPNDQPLPASDLIAEILAAANTP